MKSINHNFGENIIIYEGVNIDENVTIAPFTIIYPNVTIKKNVKIGISCIIGKPPSAGKNQTKLTDKNVHTLIGEESYIGDHAIVYQGAKIGNNCYIADKALIRENVILKNDVVIGTNVVISFNAHIGDYTKVMTGSNICGNMKIGRHCFIGVHVCSVSDNTPTKAKSRSEQIGAEIGNDVLVGSNVTLLPNIKIADKILIAAGSIVTKSLDKVNGIYRGSPAKFVNSK